MGSETWPVDYWHTEESHRWTSGGDLLSPNDWESPGYITLDENLFGLEHNTSDLAYGGDETFHSFSSSSNFSPCGNACLETHEGTSSSPSKNLFNDVMLSEGKTSPNPELNKHPTQQSFSRVDPERGSEEMIGYQKNRQCSILKSNPRYSHSSFEHSPDSIDNKKESCHEFHTFKENSSDSLNSSEETCFGVYFSPRFTFLCGSDTYKEKSFNDFDSLKKDSHCDPFSDTGTRDSAGYSSTEEQSSTLQVPPVQPDLSLQTISEFQSPHKLHITNPELLHELNTSESKQTWNTVVLKKETDSVHYRHSLQTTGSSLTPKVQSVVEDEKLAIKHAKIMSTLPPKDVLSFARLCFKKALSEATADVMTKMTELKQSELNSEQLKRQSGLTQKKFELGPVNNTITVNTLHQCKQNRPKQTILHLKQRGTQAPKRIKAIPFKSVPKLPRKQSEHIVQNKNTIT